MEGFDSVFQINLLFTMRNVLRLRSLLNYAHMDACSLVLRVEYKKESQKCVCTFFRIGWIKYIEGLTTLSECTTDDP